LTQNQEICTGSSAIMKAPKVQMPSTQCHRLGMNDIKIFQQMPTVTIHWHFGMVNSTEWAQTLIKHTCAFTCR